MIANYFRALDEFEPGSRDELLDRLRCGATTILDLSSLSKIRLSAVSRVAVARTYPLQPAPSWLSSLDFGFGRLGQRDIALWAAVPDRRPGSGWVAGDNAWGAFAN